MKAKSSALLFVLIIILVGGAVAAFLLWPNLESTPPTLVLDRQPTHIGRAYPLNITVSDQGKGLKSLQVIMIQGSRYQMVLDQDFAESAGDGPHGEHKMSVVIDPRKLGMEDGPAMLVVEARDQSWREWLHGNAARREFKVVVDTIPPRLRLISRAYHVARGGTGMALYEADPEVAVHGVQVGERQFKGYAPWPAKPKMRMCLFAYSQGEKKGAPIKLYAEDPGGNRTEFSLPVKVLWKKFRRDTLVISDRFLHQVLPRFASDLPQGQTDSVKLFQWINTKYRKANNQRIKQAATPSRDRLFFQAAFHRQPGKTMARFPDRRRYLYQGKEISQAVHLGVDLADVANSPIVAAAGGVVSFAGEMGIYGNTVIIDHGLGIASLYGHLSQIVVQKGNQVERAQQIGISGATGLALGDHLHFAVLADGVFVNPLEWWDPHWMRDNILDRLKDAGLAVPLDTPVKTTQGG